MRRSVPLVALAAWSTLVWISRIRNVLANSDLTAAGTTWRMVAALVFVVGGLGLGYAVVARAPWARQLTLVLSAWTTLWWLVRGVGILADSNHDASFKVVHTVLMLVSLGLAAWAAQHVSSTRSDD